jgi:general secretion pathway protein D
MRDFKSTLLIVALCVWPAAAFAQQEPPTGDIAPAGDAMVTLDYQNAQLEDVIRAISKLTKKNFLFDDRVRGTVTVISETPVSIDEAYRVFEAVLQVKGFSTVEGPGGVIKIVPTRDVRQSAIETSVGIARPSNTDEFITRLIPLRYVKAETIQDTFRQLASKDASLIAYGPTNTLILTDSAANIRRVLTILERIDVETYEEQLKVLTIQYADVTELTNQLREIFSPDGDDGSGGRVPRARAIVPRTNQTQPVAAGVLPQGAAIAAAGAPRFIPDTRTNSIVVLAPLGTIQQVEKLVSLLDYKRKGTGRINVYRLQNADAEEMAETLANLAEGGGGGGATPAGLTGAVADASAQTAAVVAQLEGGVKITADAPTNSLIIQSSPEAFAALSDVIEALDVRRPQVLVEALILEVRVNDTFSLGSNFIFNTLLGADQNNPVDRVGGVGSNTSTMPAPSLLDPNSAIAGLTNPGPFTASVLGKTVNFVDANGNMRTLPVIQAVITASQIDNNTNILQAPKVLTADNEEAQIVVGENRGFPTTNLQAANPAAGMGNQNNAFQTSQNIERRDVGVTLRVTPQISEGETIRLDYFNEISSVTDAMNPLGPTTSNRTVENTVYVKDGETVVIGGIITDQQNPSVTQVPYLGDIPFLGWAFKSRSEMTVKTNLLVLLTPRIVRDPVDLQALSIEKREEFRNGSREGIDYSDDEEAERKRARDAGIEVPEDKNLVRGTLGTLTNRYPTESLPELRKEREEREKQRLDQLERQSKAESGSYEVQAAALRDSGAAVVILQRLIDLGFDGTVVSRRENGDEIHVVQLGPFASEENARDAARRINAETGLNAFVKLKP